MHPILWSVCRLWVRLRRGRVPPPTLPDPLWYFAYGSNMNQRLFRKRRHMTPLETRIGRLHNHRLCFSRAGGRRPGVSAPANIVDAPGDSVHGVLYRLPARKFARLDASEGVQYGYLWVDVEDDSGNPVAAVTYKLRWPAEEGQPSRQYLALLQEAARQRGLPGAYIAFLDAVTPREP